MTNAQKDAMGRPGARSPRHSRSWTQDRGSCWARSASGKRRRGEGRRGMESDRELTGMRSCTGAVRMIIYVSWGGTYRPPVPRVLHCRGHRHRPGARMEEWLVVQTTVHPGGCSRINSNQAESELGARRVGLPSAGDFPTNSFSCFWTRAAPHGAQMQTSTEDMAQIS
nr:hypothetical protein CFP56_16686 [Quercus suber]